MKRKQLTSRLRARLPWIAIAFASTASAGSLIQTVDNSDKVICAALRKMIVAADIVGMSDQQLCDFRFARLPSASTRGFTFPAWKELKISDPVATFRKVSLGNLRGERHTAGYPTDLVLESVSVNSKDNNLKFYTTDVQYQGKGQPATLLMADVAGCPSGHLNNEMSPPALFSFNDPQLFEQEPMSPSSAASIGVQVAYWKGKIPVALIIMPSWFKLPSDSRPRLPVALMSWYRRKDGTDPEYVYEYPVCSYNLTKRN